MHKIHFKNSIRDFISIYRMMPVNDVNYRSHRTVTKNIQILILYSFQETIFKNFQKALQKLINR